MWKCSLCEKPNQDSINRCTQCNALHEDGSVVILNVKSTSKVNEHTLTWTMTEPELRALINEHHVMSDDDWSKLYESQSLDLITTRLSWDIR